MKLSDAIMLGDSMRSRNSCIWLIGNDDGVCVGCAMGGAVLAVGATVKQNSAWPGIFDSFATQWWPWLTQENLEEISVRFANVCIFASTIEQLVDYVRSIEPECGVCCRFDCTCVKTQSPILANAKGELEISMK
jgi:hypothetical protein